MRFASLQATDAVKRQQAIQESWRFVPAKVDGAPVKCRFATDGGGREITPSKVPGTPVDAMGKDLILPRVLVPVEVPEGIMAPQKEPTLRLTVDETGHVADASGAAGDQHRGAGEVDRGVSTCEELHGDTSAREEDSGITRS